MPVDALKLEIEKTSTAIKLFPYSSGYGGGENSRAACVIISLQNFSCVCNLFGRAVASEFLLGVIQSLRSLGGDEILRARVRPDLDGVIEVLFASSRPDCNRFVHACCVALATTPIDVLGVSLLPALSFACQSSCSDFEEVGGVEGRGVSHPPHGVLEVARTHREASYSASGQAGAYRADMLASAVLLKAVRTNSAQLAWQPVCHSDDRFGVLYQEGAIHAVDPSGGTPCLNDQILAVERIGAAPVLDCYTVSRAIDQLRASSQVFIGVVISSLSATQSFWWNEIFSDLSADRSIAARLFIEIRATAPFPPFGEVVAFVDRMRRLGCRIILGDFGIGFSSIRSLIALRPDGIKIDAFLLHRALRGDEERAVFLSLARLAATLASTVIVRGVDTAEQAQVANEAGVVWQQGEYHGRPSVSRRWPGESPDHSYSAQWPQRTRKAQLSSIEELTEWR